MTDQSLFVDVYVAATGVKQRVPREWLDDPKLGPPFRKTPSQRELDGELPPRPAGDAKAKDIEAFAEAAEIDLTGVKTNAEKLVAIEEALGGPAPVQAGVVEAEAPEPVDDPLAPEKVAHVDQVLLDQPEGPGEDDSTAPDAYSGEEWTFQALKDEIDARNADRDAEAYLSKGGSADDLRQRLVEDDATQAEPAPDDDVDETADQSTDSTPSTDDTESSDETPAAGDKEN